MKTLLVVSAFLATLAHADSCKPNFEFARELCEDSNEVIDTKLKKDQATYEDKREKRKGQELANAYCLKKRDELAAKWKVSPEDIRVDPDNQDSRKGWKEFKGIEVTIGTFRKIVCDYTANVPVFKKIATNNCPITKAVDKNECFKAEQVNVEDPVITGCMRMQPKNEEDAWHKTECLVEIYRAAKESRLLISILTFQQVEGSMAAFSRATNNAHLKAYLRAELK